MGETEVLANSLEQENPAQDERARLQPEWNEAAITDN